MCQYIKQSDILVCLIAKDHSCALRFCTFLNINVACVRMWAEWRSVCDWRGVNSAVSWVFSGCFAIALCVGWRPAVIQRLAAFQASARAGSLTGCCSTGRTSASRRSGPFTAGTRWRKPLQVRAPSFVLHIVQIQRCRKGGLESFFAGLCPLWVWHWLLWQIDTTMWENWL